MIFKCGGLTNNILKLFKRDWIRSLENRLHKRYYPVHYAHVDPEYVEVLRTKYGDFKFTPAMQKYTNVFEQVTQYKINDLRKTDVVLDIGANIGVFTTLVASKVKSVAAVEPLFIAELKANVQLNNLKNVVCLPYALSDEYEIKIDFCWDSKTVKGHTFKDILLHCKETPNFLKIDCEGGEWVIKPDDLVSFRAVEGEIHSFNGENPVKFLEMLQEIGFTCTHSMTKEGQMMISARREL